MYNCTVICSVQKTLKQHMVDINLFRGITCYYNKQLVPGTVSLRKLSSNMLGGSVAD